MVFQNPQMVYKVPDELKKRKLEESKIEMLKNIKGLWQSVPGNSVTRKRKSGVSGDNTQVKRSKYSVYGTDCSDNAGVHTQLQGSVRNINQKQLQTQTTFIKNSSTKPHTSLSGTFQKPQADLSGIIEQEAYISGILQKQTSVSKNYDGKFKKYQYEIDKI